MFVYWKNSTIKRTFYLGNAANRQSPLSLGTNSGRKSGVCGVNSDAAAPPPAPASVGAESSPPAASREGQTEASDSQENTGNLGRVDYISEFEFDLFIRPDTCNPRFRVWFNFTVENVRETQVVSTVGHFVRGEDK